MILNNDWLLRDKSLSRVLRGFLFVPVLLGYWTIGAVLAAILGVLYTLKGAWELFEHVLHWGIDGTPLS